MQTNGAITVSVRSKNWRVAKEVASGFDATVTATESAPLNETLSYGARRLSELAQLRSNWDSYSGVPMDPAALAAASRALVIAVEEHAPPPFIAPLAEGGVQFEWSVGGRVLELAVMPSGVVEYLAADNGHEYEDRIGRESGPTVRALVRWFVGARR